MLCTGRAHWRRAAVALAVLLACIALLWFAFADWRAAPPPPPPLILLRHATLRPSSRVGALADANAAVTAARATNDWWPGDCINAGRFLVSVAPPVTAARRALLLAEMARSGAAVAGYVPHHSFLVLANETTMQHLQRLQFVQHVRGFEPAWCLAPELDDALESADASARVRIELSTVSAPGLRIDAVRAAATALLASRGAVLSASSVAAGRSRADAALLASAPMHGKLLIEVDAAAAPAVLADLAAQSWTHWVSPAASVSVRNFFAAQLLQQEPPGVALTAAATAAAALARPLWEAGLRGERQLVGIGDSGLDFRSCYFAHTVNGTALLPGPEHRKVVAYNAAFGDALDGNGHGTHTAGSLAGSCAAADSGDAARWDGVAPDARLVFTDLGKGVGGRLYLPTSLSEFFGFAYARGARIHSDSWGGDSALYDILARETDEFAWEHRDFLPVFAAGNFGGSAATAHVANPATSKNALAVGAVLGSGGAAPHPGDVAPLDAHACDLTVVAPLAAAGVAMRLLLTGGAGLAFAETQLGRAPPDRRWPLVLAEPLDGCMPSAPIQRGNVLLLARGGCDDAVKLSNAHAAGAALAVIFNNASTGYFRIEPADGAPALLIPAATLPLAEGSQVRTLLAAATGQPLSVQLAPARVSNLRQDTIAAFSSFGPTRDGRMKPDIVAPGETRSAAAGAACDTSASAGTSMAAPLVAGAATLVRQYFTDGFHPSGARRPADAFSPSGALVKAVLLNGAAAVTGYTDAGLLLEPPPSMRQGFGRVHLGRHSLPLLARGESDDDRSDDTRARLFIADGVSLAGGASHHYCLRLAPTADTAEELRLTLAWHDPPALLFTAGPRLINDLDLTLFELSPEGQPGSVVGGGGAPPNRLDNVERRVVLSPGRAYLAEVAGIAVPWPADDTGGQPYALVATGPGLHVARLGDSARSCADALAELEAPLRVTPLLVAVPPERRLGCGAWAALLGGAACEQTAG